MRKFLKNALICALTLGFVGVRCSGPNTGTQILPTIIEEDEDTSLEDILLRILVRIPTSPIRENSYINSTEKSTFYSKIRAYYAAVANKGLLESLEKEIEVPGMGFIETKLKKTIIDIAADKTIKAEEVALFLVRHNITNKKDLMQFLKNNSKEIAYEITTYLLNKLRLYSSYDQFSLAKDIELIAQEIKSRSISKDELVTKLFREAINIIAIDSIPELNPEGKDKDNSKCIVNIVRSGVASLFEVVGKFVNDKGFASIAEINLQFNIVAEGMTMINEITSTSSQSSILEQVKKASNKILQLLKFRFEHRLTPFIGDVYTPDRLSVYTGKKYLTTDSNGNVKQISDQVYDFVHQMYDERTLTLNNFVLLAQYFCDGVGFETALQSSEFVPNGKDPEKSNIDKEYLKLIKQEFMLLYAIFLEASKRFSQDKIISMEKKIGLTHNPGTIEKLSNNEKIRIALAASGIDRDMIKSAVARYKALVVDTPSASPRQIKPTKPLDPKYSASTAANGSDSDTSSTSSSGSSGDLPRPNITRGTPLPLTQEQIEKARKDFAKQRDKALENERKRQEEFKRLAKKLGAETNKAQVDVDELKNAVQKRKQLTQDEFEEAERKRDESKKAQEMQKRLEVASSSSSDSPDGQVEANAVPTDAQNKQNYKRELEVKEARRPSNASSGSLAINSGSERRLSDVDSQSGDDGKKPSSTQYYYPSLVPASRGALSGLVIGGPSRYNALPDSGNSLASSSQSVSTGDEGKNKAATKIQEAYKKYKKRDKDLERSALQQSPYEESMTDLEKREKLNVDYSAKSIPQDQKKIEDDYQRELQNYKNELQIKQARETETAQRRAFQESSYEARAEREEEERQRELKEKQALDKSATKIQRAFRNRRAGASDDSDIDYGNKSNSENNPRSGSLSGLTRGRPSQYNFRNFGSDPASSPSFVSKSDESEKKAPDKSESENTATTPYYYGPLVPPSGGAFSALTR